MPGDPRTPGISLCAQVAHLTRCANPRCTWHGKLLEKWHGVPARSKLMPMPSGPLASCTNKFPVRRCGRVMVLCVELWGGGWAEPLVRPDTETKQLRGQFHQTISSRSRGFRDSDATQMQLLEKPSMAYQKCFVYANASGLGWTTAPPDGAPSVTSLTILI